MTRAGARALPTRVCKGRQARYSGSLVCDEVAFDVYRDLPNLYFQGTFVARHAR